MTSFGKKVRGETNLLDVDFSLAIHNRTGKYFIGQGVIDLLGDQLGSVYYGSIALSGPPSGLHGRVLGRLQRWQVMSRTRSQRPRWPRRPRDNRPLLHLDPFTVPSTELRPGDLVLSHDVGPLTHPNLFDPNVCVAYRAIYSEIAEVGPHLVFVSDASRRAFHELFPQCEPRSSRVIYPTLRPDVAASVGGVEVSGVRKPFILTVGSIGARKNQERCITAFAASGLAAQ